MELKLSVRTIILAFWDILATYAAYLLATFGTGQAAEYLVSTDVLFDIGLLAIVNIVFFAVCRFYNEFWEYASISELLKIAAVLGLATFVGASLMFLVGVRFPIRVYFVAWFILFVLVGGARYLFRIINIRKGKGRMERRAGARSDDHGDRKRTLIVGAGETGSLTINRMKRGDYYMQGKPVVAVDDDPNKQGMRIHGVKVAGGRDSIVGLVKRLGIEQIVIAIPSAEQADLRDIYNICISTNCHLLTLPNVRDIPIDKLGDVKLRDVSVADLLSRDEVMLDTRRVSGYISGKVMLVTGGGGSIGSELVRQLCLAAPRKIVVFDIYENTAYELLKEIRQAYDDVEVVVEVGSVRDYPRLVDVFEKHRPTVVFHAAAHKHVPLMEANPQEAIRNNVFGTLNLARAATLHGVDRFIFISTDKAVNPTSVMGATKKLGEMIIQSYEGNSRTVFSAVRFGNVLGSHGSVIPLFQRQIAKGGPVTVTHPDMTRYFMTIPEAARLVIEAGGLGKGGEIYVLDMGEPVKIVDLARKLIMLSGLRPDVDIEIEFVGLRPGEKLHEELLTDSEMMQATVYRDIMVSSDAKVTEDQVIGIIEALEEVVDCDADTIKRELAHQLPTYTPMLGVDSAER